MATPPFEKGSSAAAAAKVPEGARGRGGSRKDLFILGSCCGGWGSPPRAGRGRGAGRGGGPGKRLPKSGNLEPSVPLGARMDARGTAARGADLNVAGPPSRTPRFNPAPRVIGYGDGVPRLGSSGLRAPPSPQPTCPPASYSTVPGAGLMGGSVSPLPPCACSPNRVRHHPPTAPKERVGGGG